MLDPQFFPWCDSASPTSPLPWRELQPRLPLPWRELQPRLPLPWREGLGEGETHTPGIVKLWESPGRAGGLPRINYRVPHNKNLPSKPVRQTEIPLPLPFVPSSPSRWL